MPKTSKAPSEKYDALFASTLRAFMDRHPETGQKTTQKELAKHLGVQPQTVSYYCMGESLPNCEQLLKIAEFFNVTADFLITGRRTENKPVRELLGFSERTVHSISLVKDGYWDHPLMLAALDALLGQKDFYISMEKALTWNEKKAEKDDDYQEFCEWKAAQHMQSFLVEFFRYDFQKMYTKLRGDE